MPARGRGRGRGGRKRGISQVKTTIMEASQAEIEESKGPASVGISIGGVSKEGNLENVGVDTVPKQARGPAMTEAGESGKEVGERGDREEGHGEDFEAAGGYGDLEIYGDPNDDAENEPQDNDETERQEGDVHGGGDGGKELNPDADGAAEKDKPEEPFEWTVEKEDEMIDMFEKCTFLYDKSMDEYKIKNKKDLAYAEMAEKLGTDGEYMFILIPKKRLLRRDYVIKRK